MKLLNKTNILLGVIMPMIAFGQMQAPSLQELINSAIQQDNTLRGQQLEQQKTGLADHKLEDLFLPKLEISGKAGYLYTATHFTEPGFSLPPIPNIYPGLQVPDRKNTLNLSGFSGVAKAEASMLLYSGGKVKYLKEANKEKALSENQLMDKTKDDIISSITQAYDSFALLEESRKVLEESKKRLDINKKTADKALGYGLITPYDHKKIELAQATLDSKMVEYEGKKQLLLTQLEVLTGISRDRLMLIDPQLQTISYQVLDEDISKRAEIQALNHGIKASEYKIEAEKKWWVPKVQAQTSLSYLGLYGAHISTSEALLPGLPSKLNANPSSVNILPIFSAGVGFKWDIFDGNEGKHAIESAKIDKSLLENKKNEAEKKLKLNLANTQVNYQIAEAQVSLKGKAKNIAKTGLENIEKEFRYGTKNAADLITAENDLQTAELEYQTAIFNQRRAAIELMRATQNLNLNKL